MLLASTDQENTIGSQPFGIIAFVPACRQLIADSYDG